MARRSLLSERGGCLESLFGLLVILLGVAAMALGLFPNVLTELFPDSSAPRAPCLFVFAGPILMLLGYWALRGSR